MSEETVSVPTKLIEQPWETVKLTVVYIDQTGPATRTFTLEREEIEKEERAHLQAQLDAYLQSDQDAVDAEQGKAMQTQVDEFRVDDDTFKQRVITAAEKLATSVLRVSESGSNELRLLPPWNIRQVIVEVVNLKPILVLPG